jgi:hypothetical protein
VYLGPFPGVGPARFVRSAIEAALPLRRGDGDVAAAVRRGLTGDPEAILAPLAERVESLTAAGRTGDAAFAQEQLRALTAALRRQAILDGLRSSGRFTVEVGGHHVELDGGRLVSVDGGPSPFTPKGGLDAGGRGGLPGRGEADELLAVGRGLRREARAGQVRVVSPITAEAAAGVAAALEGLEPSPV